MFDIAVVQFSLLVTDVVFGASDTSLFVAFSEVQIHDISHFSSALQMKYL
jgi:hypothetical protein